MPMQGMFGLSLCKYYNLLYGCGQNKALPAQIMTYLHEGVILH